MTAIPEGQGADATAFAKPFESCLLPEEAFGTVCQTNLLILSVLSVLLGSPQSLAPIDRREALRRAGAARMHERRGIFRLWILVTAIWTAGCIAYGATTFHWLEPAQISEGVTTIWSAMPSSCSR
jgi:hypothetical protein